MCHVSLCVWVNLGFTLWVPVEFNWRCEHSLELLVSTLQDFTETWLQTGLCVSIEPPHPRTVSGKANAIGSVTPVKKWWRIAARPLLHKKPSRSRGDIWDGRCRTVSNNGRGQTMQSWKQQLPCTHLWRTWIVDFLRAGSFFSFCSKRSYTNHNSVRSRTRPESKVIPTWKFDRTLLPNFAVTH